MGLALTTRLRQPVIGAVGTARALLIRRDAMAWSSSSINKRLVESRSGDDLSLPIIHSIDEKNLVL